MQNLLKSREFWTMFFGALISIVVSAIPALEGSREQLVNALVILALAIITSMGVEKGAAAGRSGDTKIERLSK